MVFHRSNDEVAYVCCDGGVYRTTDNGASWHLRSDLLTATQLMSLGVSASGPLVINAATYSNLPYSPQKDFIPISTNICLLFSSTPTISTR